MVEVKVFSPMLLKESASHAALMCYQSESPHVGDLIDVKGRLFEVGHHTTMQHADAYKTSEIDYIAVGDVTFGLHLVSPYYNTSQRSGRFAAKMFKDPDRALQLMEKYISTYWPNVSKEACEKIKKYLRLGMQFFTQNKDRADHLSHTLLSESRPHISQENLAKNGPKIAQEQLRMFISALFPTALDFTVNYTALAAMYEEAWTPAMKDVMDRIARGFEAFYPDMKFAFKPERRRAGEWWIPVPYDHNPEVLYEPYVKDCVVTGEQMYVRPQPEQLFPLDRLPFAPELMSNALGSISLTVGMSVATMGQDQRHRSLERGMPHFTGAFYLPPLLQDLDLEKEALEIMHAWFDVSRDVPGTLAMILAPYGAMVEYTKRGSFNAILHEQYKRLCWCAQEEIYYLGVLERGEIALQFGMDHDLLTMFQPHCFETGVCAEGVRYCGRDISLRKKTYYFPHRKV